MTKDDMKLNHFLMAACLLFALVTFSCAQPRPKSVDTALPQLIWQYDTGG